MLQPRYVDTREPTGRRRMLEGVGFISHTLSVGDIQFPEAGGDTVLVENKTTSKLLEDIKTGVLIRQCRNLVENTRFPILLIDGHWAQTSKGTLLDTQFTWEQVWNQLQTLQDMGIRLQLTTDPEHTTRRILELVEYYGKSVHQSMLRNPAGSMGTTVLSLVPGIGTEKGKALLESYPTLRQLAQCTKEDFQVVPGIGPQLAQRLVMFFGQSASNGQGKI